MTEKTRRPRSRKAHEVTHKPLGGGTVGTRPVGETMEEAKALLETAYEENYSHTQPMHAIAAQQAPFLGMLKNLYAVKGIQPVKLTPEILEEIVDRLISGETLSGICMDDHMPAYKNLYKWMRMHPEVAAEIEAAKRDGTHALVDAAVDIASGGYLSTADTTRDAELIKLIKWMLGKRNTYYSENIKITHETEQRVFVLPEGIIPGQLVEDKSDDEASE